MIFELRNDAEIMASTSHRPEKIRIGGLRYFEFFAVGCGDVQLDEVVGDETCVAHVPNASLGMVHPMLLLP